MGTKLNPSPLLTNVRSGWYPSYLAQYYTGNGGRWRELTQLNGLSVDSRGMTHPWIVGQPVKIPAAWNPHSRPLAPELHGSGALRAPAGYENATPDEPMFVLLARDAGAPDRVRDWADARERAGEDPAKVAEARACADAMEAWRARRCES